MFLVYVFKIKYVFSIFLFRYIKLESKKYILFFLKMKKKKISLFFIVSNGIR